MKYSFSFSIFAFLSIYLPFNSHLSIQIPCFYLAVNFVFLAIVYGTKEVKLLGKLRNGKIHLLTRLINFPWRILSILIWKISVIISNEKMYHPIPNTNLLIGRKFLIGELPNDIDVLIDLTSEFFENKHHCKIYISFPMLDGIAPKHDIHGDIEKFIPKLDNQKVYIHCAQGHGRTATFTSFLLAKLQNITPLEAYEIILKARPKARISTDQRGYIKKYN